MGQLSQGSGRGPVREHGPRDCCLVCRSPLSEVSTVTWDAILVTVDGFGFGTLTGELCMKNVHCHTDRASWDAILVTVALLEPFCGKVRTVTQCRLGEGGGGGGSANREPGSYMHVHIFCLCVMSVCLCTQAALLVQVFDASVSITPITPPPPPPPYLSIILLGLEI